MNQRTELLRATQEATRLSRDLGLKARITEDGFTRIDPFAVAEAAELAVLVRPLPKLLGAFLREDGVPGILLNSERPIGMIRLTCAHELGHFFLGHDPHLDNDIDYTDADSITERAANQFAYNLLMPRWLIANVMRRKRWGKASLSRPIIVYQLALRLGVSYAAIVWSLKEQGIVEPATARALALVKPATIKSMLLPEGVASDPRADVWQLDQWDGDSVLEPRAQDVLTIQLPNHAGSGYRWSMEDAGRSGFSIRPVLLNPETTPKPAGPVRVGSRRELLYVVEPGQAAMASAVPESLALVEKQRWDPEAEAAGHVALDTLFEKLLDGLTPGARRRYLEEMATR